MRYGGKSLGAVKRLLKHPEGSDLGYIGTQPLHAAEWQNRRPICPYGCGEEGGLLEVVMKDGKALGIYQDSQKLIFTADLQMAPKPTGHKIMIGADGELKLEAQNE